MLGHFQRQRTGKANHAVFGGTVGRYVDVADQTGGAGDIDDPPPARGLHRRQYGAGTVEGAGQIDRQHLVPQFDRGLACRRTLGGSGVVDQDRNRPAYLGRRIQRLGNPVVVGNVGHHMPVTAAGQLRAGRLQGSLTPADQGQCRAQACQLECNRLADTAARTGHHRMAATERQAGFCLGIQGQTHHAPDLLSSCS
ncbi:hypothetical protein SDC9_173940 [bioreactor metagenome]|uniref:Uncharacterized protein n=1 Tax=bioreactor metagenome TaxID=1076179 RepID=A0A645GII7_9ZZZZ